MAKKILKLKPRLVAVQGKCSKCGELCAILYSESRPSSSEWFCDPCHLSHPFTKIDLDEYAKAQDAADGLA